jgi:Mn-containing catalase
MSEQPTYLDLLRGIANAESDAHCYLTAWRDTTTNPDVRSVLTTVASREGEHGMSFAKRVIELGFEFERTEHASLAEKMEVARSDRSDMEKAEYFGLTRAEATLSFFDNVFKDHSIDIRTGELLGRYIAEEHDTARLAKCCYDALCAQAVPAAAG